MSAPLRLVPSAPPAPDALPDPVALAADQVAVSLERLDADPMAVVRWPFSAMDHLLGALMPGSVHVVAAGTGNGKSSLLLSVMDAWAARGVPVLYLPLEIDPPTARLRWAAWRCGFDVEEVFQRHWHDHPEPHRRRLPADAKPRLEAELLRIAAEAPVHFCPASRISPSGIRRWADWGVTQFGAKVVIVDHLHQLDLGDTAAGARLVMAQAAQLLNEMAKALQVVIVAAAQLNRSTDALDSYLPPTLDRLRETSVIADVATSVLTLSRRLRPDADPADVAAARRTGEGIAELADPGTMQVTCRKHRLIDGARDRAVLLQVRGGRVRERARYDVAEDHA